MSSLRPQIINTRPVERALPLTQYLQAAGFRVIDIPMLALLSRITLQHDINKMHRWLAGDYQILVIVSPTAAALGLAVWQTLMKDEPVANLPAVKVDELPSPIIAVGAATAKVLEEANYRVLQPKTINNEGMLAMPEIKSLQVGDKVLIWRGLGGRRLLVDSLQARDIVVDSIAWYERSMPELAAKEYEQWSTEYVTQASLAAETNQTALPKPIVIISSGTAFEHWIDTVSQSKYSKLIDPTDFRYIVLGVRLATMIAEQQLDYWQVEDLSPKTILTTINIAIANSH